MAHFCVSGSGFSAPHSATRCWRAMALHESISWGMKEHNDQATDCMADLEKEGFFSALGRSSLCS